MLCFLNQRNIDWPLHSMCYSISNNVCNVGRWNYMYLLVYISEAFLSFLTDYLLSNNHVNSIIIHKFDFSDEEVRPSEANIQCLRWFY